MKVFHRYSDPSTDPVGGFGAVCKWHSNDSSYSFSSTGAVPWIFDPMVGFLDTSDSEPRLQPRHVAQLQTVRMLAKQELEVSGFHV